MATFIATVDLPTAGRSVSAARHVARELLSAWGIEHCRDDAALVVSELVANVVDHVGGDASMVLELQHLVQDWNNLIQQISGYPRQPGSGHFVTPVTVSSPPRLTHYQQK